MSTQTDALPADRIQIRSGGDSDIATPATATGATNLDAFLSDVLQDYKAQKQSPSPLDLHLNNPSYEPHFDAAGQLESVTGPQGEPAIRFSIYRDGKPMLIEYASGYRLQSWDNGRSYQERGTFPSTNARVLDLTVDEHGNVTHNTNDPMRRMTFTPDGSIIWTEKSLPAGTTRAKDATTRLSDNGRTLSILDGNNNPLRIIGFDEQGNPTSISDPGGKSWATEDGGKHWRVENINGSNTIIESPNLTVDNRGNITYQPFGGNTFIDTIDGYKILLPKS